jgi:hypothetical protein
MTTIRNSIKTDLGIDVVSLGISDASIDLKITEALRKISSYAPRKMLGNFSGDRITMPENTTCVIRVYTSSQGNRVTQNDNDVFSWSTIMMNSGKYIYDPLSILTLRSQMNTLQNYVSFRDWKYIPATRTLLLNNMTSDVVVEYFLPYTELSQVDGNEMVLQKLKEYALALCKIVEGTIRRKLQNTPGAMMLDGDSLVSEGTSEKLRLDEEIPNIFKFLRMGIRV